MIFICKSYDKDIFSKFKQDSAGYWYNERLEIEIEKRKNYISSRSKNKAGKTSEKIISKSYDNHMVNENRNVNEDINIWIEWGNLIVEGKDHFWHGRKVNQSEMDSFISVATRNKWSMQTQNEFRVSLKGFKVNGSEKVSINRSKLH